MVAALLSGLWTEVVVDFGSLLEAVIMDVATILSNDVYHIGVLAQVVGRSDYYVNDDHRLFDCVVSGYLHKLLRPFCLEKIKSFVSFLVEHLWLNNWKLLELSLIKLK